MRIEYPEYYQRFHCIADQCPDTCCAGWEVDVDEDSYYYYQIVPGAFGERLRSSMAGDDEGHWFPATEANRCPFLNDRNLCDIYIALGEEGLCQVCTEYPRYYMDIGDYEQIDMSLSCMELGRVLFCETEEIRYITEENEACPEEDLSPEDAARRDAILAERNRRIAVLQGDPEAWQTYRQEESDEDLLRVLDEFEAINEGWNETLASLHEMPAVTTFDRKDEYLAKLAIYLIYRYSVDSYLDGDDHVNARTIRLIGRSLRVIELLCAVRCEANGGAFTVDDMIDIAHRYSKEIEHSDENIERIKDI